MKQLLTEQKECFETFGKYLFGEFTNKKKFIKNTENDLYEEDKIFKEIYKFIKGEYINKKKDKIFLKSIIQLKQCLKKYPKILKPLDIPYYRGTIIQGKKLKKIINDNPSKNKNGLIIIQNYIYKPHSIIQSWTTNDNIAKNFIDEDLDPELGFVPIVLKTNDTSQMLFNPNFLNLITYNESESVRYGKDIKCDLIIDEYDIEEYNGYFPNDKILK